MLKWSRHTDPAIWSKPELKCGYVCKKNSHRITVRRAPSGKGEIFKKCNAIQPNANQFLGAYLAKSGCRSNTPSHDVHNWGYEGIAGWGCEGISGWFTVR